LLDGDRTMQQLIVGQPDIAHRALPEQTATHIAVGQRGSIAHKLPRSAGRYGAAAAANQATNEDEAS
jgi:hypothetical protein